MGRGASAKKKKDEEVKQKENFPTAKGLVKRWLVYVQFLKK